MHEHDREQGRSHEAIATSGRWRLGGRREQGVQREGSRLDAKTEESDIEEERQEEGKEEAQEGAEAQQEGEEG